MIEDFILDSVLVFRVDGAATRIDETGAEVPVDITGWTIKGSVIIDINDPSKDVPISGIQLSPGTAGLFIILITDANRDSIFATYPDKLGVSYEVKGHPSTATPGMTLARGTLILRHSRELSAK